MPEKPRRISSSGHDITRLDPKVVTELAALLDPIERSVTCMAGTERAFTGLYWQNKDPGTYVCRVCSLPLFVASTKFESGTGWPSFFAPIDPEHVVEIFDESHGMRRIEVRCARSGSHLGHVFEDGPRPSGRRFCINSAALLFVREGESLPAAARPVRSGDAT